MTKVIFKEIEPYYIYKDHKTLEQDYEIDYQNKKWDSKVL